MKQLASLSPLRSNWNVISLLRTNKIPKRGVRRPKSYLERLTKVSLYKPSGIAPRIACVKRKGNNRYTIVGYGFSFIGTFSELKAHLSSLHFTGIRMGAVMSKLM